MIEILVILLIVVIIGCFGVQLFLSQPQIAPLLQGMFVPKVITPNAVFQKLLKHSVTGTSFSHPVTSLLHKLFLCL